MDLFNSMRAVVEVANLGSFSAASRSMKMSTTSVSRLVAELEGDLGVRLFNRTTRHSALTDAGRVFLERCGTILEEVEAMREATQKRHLSPSGKLVINSAQVFGTELLAPVIPAFLDRYPGLSVDLSVSNRTVDLIEEHVDVALRIGVGGLPDSSLTAVKILEYRLIFIAHRRFVESRGLPENLEDLPDHAMVKIATGGWGHVHELATPDGRLDYTVPDTYTVNTYRGQLRAVLEGHGCALMHDIIAEPELNNGNLVRILPGYQTSAQSVYALYAHRSFVAARIRVFIDFLKEHFAARNLVHY
ncbi:MAG: LysR substrate-binding domain-containing protein [Rhizobiaceae bacterium]